jgi:hypothetical protein
MPIMAKAMTEKEPIGEKADCQSLPCLRTSGPAGASPSLQVPGAPQLLIFSSPCSWTTSLSYVHHPRGCLHSTARLVLAGVPPWAWKDHTPEQTRVRTHPYRVPAPCAWGGTSGRKENAVPQQEFLSQNVGETRDEGWVEEDPVRRGPHYTRARGRDHGEWNCGGNSPLRIYAFSVWKRWHAIEPQQATSPRGCSSTAPQRRSRCGNVGAPRHSSAEGISWAQVARRPAQALVWARTRMEAPGLSGAVVRSWGPRP